MPSASSRAVNRKLVYAAEAFEIACRRQGIIQSMARVGSALDDAVSEAFHSTIKIEHIHRHHFRTREQARNSISNWITGFYNPRRRSPRVALVS